LKNRKGKDAVALSRNEELKIQGDVGNRNFRLFTATRSPEASGAQAKCALDKDAGQQSNSTMKEVASNG